MIKPTVSDDYTILNVTVTSTATLLRNLILTALAVANKTMPEGDVIQVGLYPTGAITIQDTRLGIETDMVVNTLKLIPAHSVLDVVKLKSGGAVTCVVELYYQSK